MPFEGIQPLPLSSFVCQLISPYLDTPQLNTLNFGELLTDLIQYHIHKDRLPGIVTRVYRYKLNNWARTSPEYGEFIHDLTENIWTLYEKLCLYKLVANYPKSLRIKCLGEGELKRIEKAGLNLEGLDIDPFQKESDLYTTVLTNELSLFFHGFEKAHPACSTEHIEELLGYCSGELTKEVEYILMLLKANLHLIDNPLITRLKTTFRTLLPLYNRKIEEFRAYVPPPKPSPFNKDAGLQTIVDWAVQEYLPYKFWLETTRQQEPEILTYGKDFAEYIFDHYENISYHYENVLYRFLFNYKALIAGTPLPILLIIDNFNYKFFSRFQASLAQHALVSRHVEPYLSLLPSETILSKKGIISGKRDQVETIQYSYEKNLIESWQEYFPNHTLIYLSKAGELDEYAVKGNEFIVINYIEIDAELHKSYQKTAIEHRKAVTFVIEHLTELLANFIKRNHLETKARIFLVSDHGSTSIPETIPNQIDIEYFKGQAIDNKHRFLSVSDKQFQTMRHNVNIADSVFFLNKDTSGDEKNYVIAREYNRFKDIREDFYVHGGALPEELIVPVGCFEYNTQEVKNLIVQLVKTGYRLLTKETLVLRIANPNALPVKNIFIKVVSHDIPLAAIEIGELGDNDETEVSQEIRIKHKEMNVLQFEMYYEIAGRSFQETTEQPITIKTMTQAKFDFDEW